MSRYVNELKRDMEMKATVDEIERSITDLQMVRRGGSNKN